MAEFSAALSSSLSTNGQVIFESDDSNYLTNTEAGHSLADFSDFKIVKVFGADGVDYYFATANAQSAFSFTADTTIDPPSTASTLISNYSVPSFGDGVYKAKIYIVPTYNPAVTYQANDDYVYAAGVLYKCIQTGTGHVPFSSPLYWEPLNDYIDLPEKYYDQAVYVRTYDLENDYAAAAQKSICDETGTPCDEFFKKCSTAKALKLKFTLDSVSVKEAARDYTSVSWLIGIGKSIQNTSC